MEKKTQEGVDTTGGTSRKPPSRGLHGVNYCSGGGFVFPEKQAGALSDGSLGWDSLGSFGCSTQAHLRSGS